MPARNSFITGFLAAMLLAVGIWLYRLGGIQGGHGEDSPSGKFTLLIMGPMSPRTAGTYSIYILEKATGRTLRKHTIQLDRSEKTNALRGSKVAMTWDSAETYGEILIEDKFLVRISLPAIGP